LGKHVIYRRFWGKHAIYQQILGNTPFISRFWGKMDLPERIRIGRQLNLRLANGYIVEEATFNGPYGAICFKTSYYYREKFYSLETKELLFSLDAVDESTVYPIDNEFMEYHTEYNQHLIINTVTFKVLNAYEYYDKYGTDLSDSDASDSDTESVSSQK
jgi:hypothetical protein